MDSLGDRMKNNYENRTQTYLTRRMPVIMRLDGRAFHTFTKRAEKPFDKNIMRSMVAAANQAMYVIQGAKCAYVQSDEISILITDYDRLETQAWFDYNVQKMCSVAASTVATYFMTYYGALYGDDESPLVPTFDCRVFNIPKDDVTNYFIWRQKDWFRNSLQMYTRSFYTHNEVAGKKALDMHEMLYAIGKNWVNDLTPAQRNGTFIVNGMECSPMFMEHRDIIESFL